MRCAAAARMLSHASEHTATYRRESVLERQAARPPSDWLPDYVTPPRTPAELLTPTATAPIMEIRFRIGIEIDVESLIFIIVVFIESYQYLRSTSCTLPIGCWFPAVFV